ncbi:MAG: hypothetical protein LIP23_06225 [Planctomycetes bacterium]|nr:hypothetical protein [Planctomycetota bacterium]
MNTPRNDVTRIKEINTDVIKTTLKSLGKATKSRISEITGISVATCGKILNELCLRGEVLEASIEQSDYGRPAKSYSYNAWHSFIACLCLHGEATRPDLTIHIYDLIGTQVHESVGQIENLSYEHIRERVINLRSRQPKLSAVTLGIPGHMINIADPNNNEAGLDPMLVCQLLRRDFSDLKIAVENSANAAAYGFYKAVCDGRDTTIAYLASTAPTMYVPGCASVKRLSVGLISNSHIVRGFSGFAGEIGYLTEGGQTPDEGDYQAGLVREMQTAIIALTVVANPEIIALSGEVMKEEVIAQLRTCCLRFPIRHRPQLALRENPRSDVFVGLMSIALELLSCSVRLVYKNL